MDIVAKVLGPAGSSSVSLLEAVEEQLQTSTPISSLILVVNLINAILKSN